MATFNVFVEGPVDESPTALPELAEAMSQRYGIPAADLVARLKRGRFRVKSNLDAANAERYRQDLQSIGARVLVEDSALSPTATPVAGTPIVRASGPSLPVPNRPATPPTGLAAAGPQHARPSTPPPTRAATPAHGTTTPPANRPTPPPSALAGYARPSTPPPIAASQRPSTPIPSDMVSGLSAGFGDSAQADLGALSEGSLSLASLDGEEAPAASNQFDTSPQLPPEEKPAVSFAPPKPKAEGAPRKKPGPSKPMDLFAPPDAGDQDLVVEFATEEKEERAAKQASAPPETAPSPSTTRRTPVTMQAADEPTARPQKQFSRGNFVAAIVVALAIGFIPAHLVANMREKSAFATIDNQVAAAHASADSHETYAALDGAREKLLDDKQSKRTMIALTSMLLWAVVGAGVAFALLRYTPKKQS
jgi:hypothetical protein